LAFLLSPARNGALNVDRKATGSVELSPATDMASDKSKEHILRPLASGEQRQSLPCDEGLKVIAALVSGESGCVFKQLIKNELGRISLAAGDPEELDAGLGLGARQEAAQDIRHPLGLSGFRLPLCDNQWATSPE
jgi:hypothetical protein